MKIKRHHRTAAMWFVVVAGLTSMFLLDMVVAA